MQFVNTILNWRNHNERSLIVIRMFTSHHINFFNKVSRPSGTIDEFCTETTPWDDSSIITLIDHANYAE